MEGNLLSDIENGTFLQLKFLKELHIGEHNFASKTIINEIAKHENLEVKKKFIAIKLINYLIKKKYIYSI